MCASVILLCFVVCYVVSIVVCDHLHGEKRAGSFILFVFLVSRDCCLALPHGATDFSAVCNLDIS